MHTFQYVKAKSFPDALKTMKVSKKFIAGGTSLVDLMKLEVEAPQVLVDVNHLPWNKIEEKNGEWNVGALVKNSELANHKGIKAQFAALSEALLSGATAQLRNKASVGGNLLQRTRCVYFRDPSKDCNKRLPGSGCSALEGFNRNLAVLGTSSHCIASNPSDMNVALSAFEAKVHLQSSAGMRDIAFEDFHLLPGTTPHIETVVHANELITGMTLPKLLPNTSSLYLKLRDRASYEFALSSVAVVISMDGGRIGRIRLAMGGIGTKPWRVPAAEKLLEGQAPSDEIFQVAAKEFLKGAKGYSDNSFKIELARRCLVQGLKMATSRRKA